MWGGDQEMTAQGLQLAVRMAQTAGVAGFAVWGSDIGGYSGEIATPNLDTLAKDGAVLDSFYP